MKDKLLNNRDKWCRSIFVTMLAGVAAEIVFILYGTIWGDRESSQFVPWTFHTVWEIAVLVGIAYTVKKCKINLWAYIVGLLSGVILGSIVWMCIPHGVEPPDPNYYGVESRISMETHEEGRYEERVEYDYPLTCGFLYRRDDPSLKRAIDEAVNGNEYVSTEGFLFWQTGLARGFSPIGISGYNGGNGIYNRIELCFTVGPMVIVESFIKGLAKYFIILMLAQIIWFMIRKEQVWWDTAGGGQATDAW